MTHLSLLLYLLFCTQFLLYWYFKVKFVSTRCYFPIPTRKENAKSSEMIEFVSVFRSCDHGYGTLKLFIENAVMAPIESFNPDIDPHQSPKKHLP